MRKLSDDYLDFKIVRAKNRKTGELVLIKEILKETILSNRIYEKIFYKEINLMKIIKSDHFVKFLEFYENSTHFIIVTEYFEGKILDNFLNRRKSLSENLVEKIVKKILPAIKYLDDNNILLEFISTKSFCFKYYINEDNFEIKFFDYGLSSVYLDDIDRKKFLLLETEYGNLTSKKSNVVSFGILIYKLLFGETIYKFSKNEDPKETLKSKYIFYFYN
jgi:serine/threonine protein kinase